MTDEQTLADELVAERRRVYGNPEETFARVAQIWSGILGTEVQATDVALCMIGYKLLRTQVCPTYSDNSDDIDGYLDIFRRIVGDDMVAARSVNEYLEKLHEQQQPEKHIHFSMIRNGLVCSCGATFDMLDRVWKEPDA